MSRSYILLSTLIGERVESDSEIFINFPFVRFEEIRSQNVRTRFEFDCDKVVKSCDGIIGCDELDCETRAARKFEMKI